jgi:hypothetical protein
MLFVVEDYLKHFHQDFIGQIMRLQSQGEEAGVGRIVVMFFSFPAGIGNALDLYGQTKFLAGGLPLAANSFTEKVSTNWLKTRYCPAAAGWRRANCTQAMVSMMLR